MTPEQIASAQKDEKDMKDFNEGLQALIQRTKITIVPELKYDAGGIRPILKLGRLREEPVSPNVAAPKEDKPKKNGKKAKS